MNKKNILFYYRLLFVAVSIVLFAFNNQDIAAQLSQSRVKTVSKPPPKPKPKPKFPDKYSPLDNSKASRVLTEEIVEHTIEAARQSYIKGLIVLQKNDTVEAVQYFEKALTELSKLASYSELENDEVFQDLSQSIHTDYENCIKNREDNTDDMLVPKEKLFQTDASNNKEDKGSAAASASVDEFRLPPNADTVSNYIFAIPKIDELTIPLSENSAIDAQIEFLTKGKGARYMPRWIERSSRWFPMMREISRNEGMPDEILVLTFIESGLRPDAESKAKAVGFWQFMHPTGMEYGLNKKQSIWVDERRDPIKSTRAAMRYIRDLYLWFNDWYLTLNAYNWGWGNVRRALKQTNKTDPTFWDIRNQKNIKMPNEAREYVPLFLAVLKITSEPEKYGIDVSKLNYLPEFKFDVVEIEQAVNLSAVAKVIGTGVEEIRELNPELLYNITPPDRKYYRLRVPPGLSKDFNRKFAQLPLEEKQPSLNHRVERGEDIISIAEKFDVSIDELIRLNAIKGEGIALTYNTELKIPIGGKTYAQSTLALSKNSLVAKSELLATDSNFYVVRANESVYSVAAKYKINPANLRNWNNLPIDQDLLDEGRVIITSQVGFNMSKTNNSAGNSKTIEQKFLNDSDSNIDNSNVQNKSIAKKTEKEQNKTNDKNKEPIKQPTTTHKVEKGETIYRIATLYRMTEKELKELNSEKIKNDKIKIGDILIVSNVTSPDVATKSDTSTNKNRQKEVAKKTDSRKEKNKKETTYYIVKEGDNLSKIAQKYNTDVQTIISLNKNIKPDKLSLGQKIIVK